MCTSLSVGIDPQSAILRGSMVPCQRRRDWGIPSLPILKNAMATCQGRGSAQAVVAFMVALAPYYYLLGAKDGEKRFADTAIAP